MILKRRESRIVLLFIKTFLIFQLYSAPSYASPDYWPTDGWRVTTPEEQGIDSGKLVEMFKEMRNSYYAIDSITIIRNGYMVADAYFYPFQKNLKHPIYSCTKSITSILVGIAIDKGYIKSVKQPILDFFPEKTITNLDARKRSITLEHLLTMASGLETKDSWLYQWAGLMKMVVSEDWAQYVLDRPMAEAPGNRFEYSNCVSYLLSAIIQTTTKMRTIDFARKYLFEPLGITDIKWPSSPQEIAIGFGEIWLKPHDMAKIGWLYLNKGRWNGTKIVSAKWVETSTKKHISANIFDGYGYQWWIDIAGYYIAVGHLGQFIFVIPAKDMVVVCTGDLEGNAFFTSKKLLDKYIIPSATSTKPLHTNPKANEQLDSLVASFAQASPKDSTWTTANDGVATNGVFIRKASPGFRFEYPQGSKQVPTNRPDQIMRMKTLGGEHFAAGIDDIPQKIKLPEVGSIGCASILNKIGSNIRVVSNKGILLKDGTEAYRTDIEWMWYSVPITTVFVNAYKDGKWVYVSADSPRWRRNIDEMAVIVESLTFE